MIRRVALVFALLLAPAQADEAPLDKAYDFLEQMMDLHAHGDTLRLAQSFVATPTFDNGDTSYTYDDAVVIVALLARRTPEAKKRARILGDALVTAQAHDAAGDGRLRDAYHTDPFLNASGAPRVASAGSYTGNMAWAAMALLQLWRATHDDSYRDAAQKLADFIVAQAYDARGKGGFTGGLKAGGDKLEWKSTEHNIDAYALFKMLGDRANAQHALRFVKSMWSRKGGHYFIGTGLDGVAINRDDPTPEDVQTWSYLSTGLASHQGSIDWALANLSATSGDFQGLSFEERDRSGVWFEGTAHAAAALEARAGSGDLDAAELLLLDIETGQASAPNADGSGIDAASKDGLKTDDSGDAYYAALHTGATGWYCLAKLSANPFKFPKRVK
ncbi:MAG TPA: hypothetical protein VG889_02915 [Rhizomicrobium sp.]|nr:hypothetical protein [Rhizomicrobium sp.]